MFDNPLVRTYLLGVAFGVPLDSYEKPVQKTTFINSTCPNLSSLPGPPIPWFREQNAMNLQQSIMNLISHWKINLVLCFQVEIFQPIKVDPMAKTQGNAMISYGCASQGASWKISKPSLGGKMRPSHFAEFCCWDVSLNFMNDFHLVTGIKFQQSQELMGHAR